MLRREVPASEVQAIIDNNSKSSADGEADSDLVGAMHSVSMEDLSQIENQLLRSDDEDKVMDTSTPSTSEKSEEEPQLETNGSGPSGADSTVSPDKKNDEKSKQAAIKTEPDQNSKTDNNATLSPVLRQPAVQNADADDDDDANMEPVVLGSYTIKDLTIKDPTDTEINTKDLFEGTIQLLRQILGLFYNISMMIFVYKSYRIINVKLIKDSHYFSNPKAPNLQAEMTLSPSPTHQMVIRIRQNGEYLVPRCATELIVPLLTHPRIEWTFVGYNGKRKQGIDPYIRYLGTALNEVIIF